MDTATGKPVATKEESEDVHLSASETGSEEDVTGNPVAYKTATAKPYASSKSDHPGSPKAERKEWSHNPHASPATIHHAEAVFSIVREVYEREQDDPMNDLDVNMAILGIFLNGTLRAAVHFGQDYEANLLFVNNNLWNIVRQLFNESEKLISEQKEVTGISTTDFKDATWMSTSLQCEKAFQITNAKIYVLSVSVLCVGKMGDDPIATWKSKIQWYSQNNHFQDVDRIHGDQTEFEWKIFPRITTLGLLEKIQSLMRDPQCEPEHFKDRIIFMSMFNDIDGKQKETKSNVNTIHRQLWIMLANSLAVNGLSWGLDQKRSGAEPDESWDRMT